MLNENNFNILQDSKGHYSMARFAVLMALVMGMFNGALIPWSANATECMSASLGYFAIAVAGKVTSKITEGSRHA